MMKYFFDWLKHATDSGAIALIGPLMLVGLGAVLVCIDSCVTKIAKVAACECAAPPVEVTK